tara:strand:+ start:55 stop:462 length:408 start_codon:yes stop_codon:yes gene_type:complete
MLRKTMPKTAKKPTRSRLVKKLDTVFSQYIRLRDADNRGMSKCFTCGKEDHWKKLQAGHFQSRRHYSTRWHEDNVQVQCQKCNLYNQGEQFLFAKNLGLELAETLSLEARNLVKFSSVELEEMINYYSKEVKKLT